MGPIPYTVHDFQLAYDFSKSGLKGGTLLGGARVYVGANNLLNEEAPIILTGVPGNIAGTDTDASVYDPVGRTWYAGVNFTF